MLDSIPQKTVTFELDGKALTVNEGTTILKAAQAGHLIPHLCHKPEPGYRSDGNCRACMVEIDGERVLTASCIRVVENGMVVHSQSERAVKSQALVVELLAADQPQRSHDASSHFSAMAELNK